MRERAERQHESHDCHGHVEPIDLPPVFITIDEAKAVDADEHSNQ